MITANGHHRTVLVVEDNPDDTLLLDLAAKESCPDISFVFVPDGPDALAYLRGEGQLLRHPDHGTPSLVLVDAHMPQMNGYELVRRIRALPQFQQVKVLLWTDWTEPEAEDRARQVGADLFLRKPGAFSELMEEVKRICELARA